MNTVRAIAVGWALPTMPGKARPTSNEVFA